MVAPQHEHDIVVIDNYDSFTWNIVEYLSAITAREIDVYRNDKITVDALAGLRPRLLVISPGPGHPETDAGISADAIARFAGKIPILGVCMGQQCMFTVFGGKVEQTGEILHGKTSPVQHDGKGIYRGVPQSIAVTRYHSLAGTQATLPDCLEVTCRTEGGVIMGVRHRDYAIEGVQYHPESILSEGGKLMMENFLKLQGGTWAENPHVGLGLSRPGSASVAVNTSGSQGSSTSNGKPKKTILETIHEQRLLDIAAAKSRPGATPADLQTLLRLNLAPAQIDFPRRLRQNLPEPGVMAEIKRASPSKGDIDIDANAAQQALLYARGGASVMSVLTEPHWFKGHLEDLRAAREAIAHLPNRPALLRKDFIIDRYQIDEARIYGADTVLLIVAMLSEDQLIDLYAYARTLGMEPLVEVNNAAEMAVARRLGARVVGVNNRNLHDFVVDLETTSKLAVDLDDGMTLCALSGITGRADVVKYAGEGVKAVLVGEALMRAPDKGAFIDALRGRDSATEATATTTSSMGAVGKRRRRLVKICGTRTVEGALAAAEAGADFIGVILVAGRRRTVDVATARKIVEAVRSQSATKVASASAEQDDRLPEDAAWFDLQVHALRQSQRPLVVGVFQNQPLEYILRVRAEAELDIVQLHGDEPLDWARLIPGPVFRAFGTQERGLAQPGLHTLPLIDGASVGEAGHVKGGTGETVDWTAAARAIRDNDNLPCLLAGGLTPDNVAQAIRATGAAGVDVSSGVETDGVQDADKIRAFVKAAREA